MAKSKSPTISDRTFGPCGAERDAAAHHGARCSVARSISKAVGSLSDKLLSTVFVTNAVSKARSAAFAIAWYVPALFVVAMGVTALYSPRAALWLLLAGCLALAGGLFLVARLIRRRYHALLAKMPKIHGQTPKRLEFHAVVLGVGDRPSGLDALNPMDLEESLSDDDDIDDDVDIVSDEESDAVLGGALNEDDIADRSADRDEEIEDVPLAVGDDTSPVDPKVDAAKVGKDSADEELSAFEIYEVPLLRRERRKKTFIH